MQTYNKYTPFIQGQNHLEAKYNSVISHGGEGIMLRKPGSLYSTGRTDTLYRYKKFTDTEVLVLEILPHGLKCLQYIFFLKNLN